MDSIPIGQVVRSIAGRDKNRYFVVLACEAEYIQLADGVLRRVDTPKRKKSKHVKVEKDFLPVLAEKLKNGTRIFDAEVRKSLESLGYTVRNAQQKVLEITKMDMMEISGSEEELPEVAQSAVSQKENGA